MKNFFVRRLLIYPAIFGIVWTFLFVKYPEFIFVKLVQDELTYQFIRLEIPMKTLFILFGMAFGYVYGTISTLVKASQFRGIIFLFIFLFKVMISMTFAISIGYILYAIELVMLPVFLVLIRKIKEVRKNQRKKVKNNNLSKEDLIIQLENLISQYKNA
jgi:hypothetical protein